jgi:hypothetical protein
MMFRRESPRFSLGDRVRNKNPHSAQFGRVGIVEKIYLGNPTPFLAVRYDGDFGLRDEFQNSFELETKT